MAEIILILINRQPSLSASYLPQIVLDIVLAKVIVFLNAAERIAFIAKPI